MDHVCRRWWRGTPQSMTPEKLTAVQAVIDRVAAYQDGATEGTVEKELRAGFDEAGVSLDDAEVTRLVEAIEAEQGVVDASEVLA